MHRYLDAFENVCNSSLRITGLKMPDYIVMSTKTIQLFHVANPTMRIVVTVREPVARMYSYYKKYGHEGTICMPASWRPSRGTSDPAFAIDEIVALAGVPGDGGEI